ncbi:MAG TPA: ribosome small subunit-dependent GTPase A [Bacteroidales bacterium]|nr:ribosome small subunit-dependent GTPase A [Bacteroidales bacterium]
MREKTGRVIKSTGSWMDVLTDSGEIYECKIKGKFRIKGIRSTNPVAVGDVVDFRVDRNHTGLITGIRERRNYIIRKSTKLSKASHMIAANIDQAFLIVTLALPRTSRGFIDRFLVTAEAYHIPATLVFNKIDLYDEELLKKHEEWLSVYSDCGYPAISVSAETQVNINSLKNALRDKTTLLAGHSGVGKTALINALDPKQNRKTGVLSEVHDKGKHTTTFAEMLHLDFGAEIIDTPGIKEFGLYDFNKEEVAERFPEMRERMHECRFHNCTHVHEPGCAVKDAVEQGEIDEVRYKNYLSIIKDEYFDIKEWD